MTYGRRLISGEVSELPYLFLRDRDVFLWHSTVHEFKKSAQVCSLCAIVDEGYTRWLSYLEEAVLEHNKHVVLDIDLDEVKSTSSLWLTKRHEERPGFLVFIGKIGKRPSGPFFLVTVINFIALSGG